MYCLRKWAGNVYHKNHATQNVVEGPVKGDVRNDDKLDWSGDEGCDECVLSKMVNLAFLANRKPNSVAGL